MTRHIIRFLFSAWALLVLPALPGCAQERPLEDAQKRGACVVRFASAKELAGVLSEHFKGVASIQASPDGLGNVLLVSAPPAVFDEVMKTLAQMDSRPRPVSVDLFIVELPARKADAQQARLDPKDLSGATEEVAQRLEAMAKNGQAESIRRVQLSTLDGQLGSMNMGTTMPFATGATTRPSGGVIKTIQYQTVGTLIKVAPHVEVLPARWTIFEKS